MPRDEVRAALPGALVEPPISRGDLGRLQGEGVRDFLVIDGVFAHRLAVAPSEVVDAMSRGARLLGAASMGAIRATECRPAGMRGDGAVYRLYRLGVLRDDDEVAVATDPESGHAAVSVALVHVRYVLIAALRAGALDRVRAAALLDAARRTHFADRRWDGIWRAAGVRLDADLRRLIGPADVKRRDARRAVARMAAGPIPAAPPRLSERRLAPHRLPGGDPSARYRGHDPMFGRSAAELRGLIGDERWERAATEGTLDRELMRWYAADRLGADSPNRR